jgi:hypothetical protein
MRPWERYILAIAATVALYAMWRFPIHGAGVVVLTLCALWLGRSIYRTKLSRSPLGENRDFSIRPVLATMMKAVGLFVAAILWTMLLAYARCLFKGGTNIVGTLPWRMTGAYALSPIPVRPRLFQRLTQPISRAVAGPTRSS